jgi:hypothetical protein
MLGKGHARQIGIDRREPALPAAVVPGAEVIEARLRISFFVTKAVTAVALSRRRRNLQLSPAAGAVGPRDVLPNKFR